MTERADWDLVGGRGEGTETWKPFIGEEGGPFGDEAVAAAEMAAWTCKLGETVERGIWIRVEEASDFDSLALTNAVL